MTVMEEKYPENTLIAFPDDGGCFGCSQSNDSGLQLTFMRRGDTIVSEYTIEERFHGAPAVAHGGIIATIFDEVSCAVLFFLRDTPVVTGELSIRYEAPCPVDRPVTFQAEVNDESHERYAVVSCRASLEDIVVARSTGKFFYQPIEE